MNILHVIASPSPGGIESFVRDLAIESVNCSQSVHVCFVETAKQAGTSEKYETEYLAKLVDGGVRFDFIGRNSRWLPWRGILRVNRYIADNSIDIYHSHLTYGIVFGVFLSTPRVYTHHSIDMRVGRVFFSFLNRFVEQLVGISDKCSTALARHSRRDVPTILNGVNLKRILTDDVAPRKLSKNIRCLLVGRVCEEKNYLLLVEAVALLPSCLRNRLTVKIAGAGSSELTDRVEDAISESGLKGIIQLLGSRDDIPQLLASSQLFLMSSSSEGLPIALIEAAISGLPCVVTDAGGCSEIVKACENGLVVELGNPQAFSDAIVKILSDSVRFSELSTNALCNSNVFSIEAAATSYYSLYRSLLEPPQELTDEAFG